MAYKPVERLTFFEIFKEYCGETDLGPISLNWFEELSAEAPSYEPKLLGELDGPFGWMDQTPFKTLRSKPATYSQLASTPLIFKEENTILPPYSSPGKELDQNRTGTCRKNLVSPSITRGKIGPENEVLASPPDICCNYLATSPTILRNTYRTPQRNNMPGPYGSLFCTPKLLEVRTPKRISESLGAEVDPDMSWSSSLATPPTLGATVLIARESEAISGAKQQDERADTILHNFSSNHDRCPGMSDTSMLFVPETVNAEDDIKDFESEMLDVLFGEMNSFEDTFNVPAKSSGALLLMPHALDAVEKCEINTDQAQGKGDVPSWQPIGRKTDISQEVKTTSWTEKSHSTEMKGSLLQNTDEPTGHGKDSCLIECEKELESLRIVGDMQDYRTHKPSENEKPLKEDLQSSSSQWSQLNLSDLDVTHLEMSVCSSPPSDLLREKNLEKKSVLVSKDDAVEASLLNTSGLIKAQKLLSVNLSEKHYEVKNSENNPTSEITPVKSVSLSVRDPKLVKGCVAEKVSKMSFLNCNSFLIESTNVTEYSVVYNGSFSKHLKATSKSVVTDVLSHPLVCSATSPDNFSDLNLTNRENTLTKSSFKSLNTLSSFRKRSKRFIYTINNTLLYQEEKIQKGLTSESPTHHVWPHLESDSCELKGCRVASVEEQDWLFLAEGKHLQSTIKENNFSTCTLKMDIMGNSSGNSFKDRLKQQDPRVLEENAREDHPATSIKCLEVSNTQKEDTTDSLNSEIISNIKRRVLTSACLMARKRSRLLPKGHCLEKGTEGKYMSADVNDGATVPQSLKEPLAWPSPRDNGRLIDMHPDATALTNGSFNDTLSQINFGISGGSSDCSNKIPADKRHATDQWSVVDCREVLGPLGIDCSEDGSTGLKQGDKTDAAAFSEVVTENQEPKSVENNESPQAAASNNVAGETAEDCIDDNSLNEVISEEGKQVAPLYSSTKSKENLKYKGKSSGNLNTCSLNLGFGGFQTASNKQIKFSEVSIAKGRMLFKDIENEYSEASSTERVRSFSNQLKKENNFFSDSESKLGSNLSDSLESQTGFLEPRHSQSIPHKVGLCKSFPRSQQSLQEANQTLTASQEAEIAELSSILEETGSQFEFTQFRKHSNMVQSHVFQQFGTTHGTTNVEKTSENPVKNDRCCTRQENINEDSKMVEYKEENAVAFHKNDKKLTFTNLDTHADGSFPVPKQDSFSNYGGFISAGGKKINISKESLTRSAELFRDLDDDNYLFKSCETSTRCHNSNGHMSSNGNFVRCLTKENKGKTVCVSDFKSRGAISHHAQKKNVDNISTQFKEDMENRTKISINDNENVDFSSTNAIVNSLTSIKKRNQNHKASKQFLNQGDCQVEGSLQEDSSDVTCLGDATKTAEECSLSDEMENLSPNQKGEDRKENERLSQDFRTPASGDISISDAALDHSLHLLNVQCGERDVNVLENSDKQKTNHKNMEGEATTQDINLFMNERRIKTGSHHHHQIPFEQEVDVEKNEVKGSYLTAFHTASGKKITIADGFLAKAERFFAENVDEGKEQNGSFENPIKKRKCGKNCFKDCNLYSESIAQCDPEKLNFNKKIVPEVPGDQFKAVESSPIKHAVIRDTVKADTFVNPGEDCGRSLVTSYMYKKADVRPGKSGLESLPGQESDALSRTRLSEDGKLLAVKEMEYSPEKTDDGFPVHSAATLHSMKVSNDLEDNSVPGDTENTLFVGDSSNKSNQSLPLTSKSSCAYLNCNSKEFDLEHLNEPCADTNCFTDTIVNACQNQSLDSLPKGETNLTALKETTPNVENQKGDLKQIVFSTAKGKAVSVSESALARVRQMFQEDYSESVKYEMETNSRINQTEIAGNSSSVIHAECPNSAKYFNAARSEELNSATSRFIEVNARASENGHQDTDMFADAKSVSNSQRRWFEQNIKLLGHLPGPDKQIKQADSSASNLESLRKARQLFSEMEGNNNTSHEQEAFSVEEAVEKSETPTEVVPRKMWTALPKGEENASTELISEPAFGFSTASGKQVTVSKNAYQKAKAILKESDDFLSSGLCKTDQLYSTKDSGQHVKSLTDGVISESKIEKSCNEDFDLKTTYLEEMTSFPSTHHVKMPEYVPHSKKNKQLTSFKNSFQQEKTKAFGKGQLNLGMNTEPAAVSCSATAKAEMSLLQTPKYYLEVEAVESARAFMEDDFSDSAQSSSGRLDKNFPNKTFGKRHFEENSLGEPPIKRQLLLEFNRANNPPRSLEALKSTPEGNF
ncbi:Breast cancer type 2 susceptibility protein, partial [Leptosomus discolor]